jgi:L-methionine (R)-S-oxide reductase
MFDAKELVKELQGMRDDGHLSDALLRRGVRKIAASDKKVSWAGVYLLKEDANELWLHNYVGSPTEHAKIPVGSGVCGTAVAQKANQNVPDVKKFENYLSCNPDVQSELVVLIRAGDIIFGEIDIDSEEPKAFKPEDEAAVQQVADKLAEQLMAEKR